MKTEDLIIAYMKTHKGIESDSDQKALEVKTKLKRDVSRAGK